MYAAELDADGIVLQVIVGNVAWAETYLGGQWVSCRDDSLVEFYPGIGWGFAANHSCRFAPVAPPDVEKTLATDPNAIPAGSLWWDNGVIETIETIAERRGIFTLIDTAIGTRVRSSRSGI